MKELAIIGFPYISRLCALLCSKIGKNYIAGSIKKIIRAINVTLFVDLDQESEFKATIVQKISFMNHKLPIYVWLTNNVGTSEMTYFLY